MSNIGILAQHIPHSLPALLVECVVLNLVCHSFYEEKEVFSKRKTSSALGYQVCGFFCCVSALLTRRSIAIHVYHGFEPLVTVLLFEPRLDGVLECGRLGRHNAGDHVANCFPLSNDALYGRDHFVGC